MVGTLEPGKQADLAAFPLDGAGPIQDPVTAAVFSITGARARFVSVAGKPLVRDGVLVSPARWVGSNACSHWAIRSPSGSRAGGEMAGVV